jgi:hypothetical protein
LYGVTGADQVGANDDGRAEIAIIQSGDRFEEVGRRFWRS